MELLVTIIVALVAFLHLYFLYFEMFAWQEKGPALVGKKSADFFKETKVMAANQGLYNGFLAAGLIWSFFIEDPNWSVNVRYFFLICVIIAGLYGAATASKKILYIQAMPALLALGLCYLNSL